MATPDDPIENNEGQTKDSQEKEKLPIRILLFLRPRAKLYSLLLAIFTLIVALPCFHVFHRAIEVEEHAFTQSIAESTLPFAYAAYGPIVVEKLKAVSNRTSDDQNTSSAYLAELADLLQNGVPDEEDGDSDSDIHHDLEIYLQDFSFFDDTVQGQNLIALIPSARGHHRDSFLVVFAADWSGKADDELVTAVGVAVARHLRTQQWMSRDTVFLFVNSELPFAAGVRKFLGDYLEGRTSPLRRYARLSEDDGSEWIWDSDFSNIRRGVLRLAMCLRFDVSNPTGILLDVEGPDGLLPNQDLVNSFSIEAKDQSIHVATRPVWDSVYRHIVNSGADSLHAPFLLQAIPAFTAVGVKPDTYKNYSPTVRFLSLAKTIEKTVRGQSNLLQTLHHSFGFYFFTDSTTHVSSGVYMYFAAPLILPLIVWPSQSPAVANSDLRGLIVGYFVVFLAITVGGLPTFLAATQKFILFNSREFLDMQLASPLLRETNSTTAAALLGLPTNRPSLQPECTDLLPFAKKMYHTRVAIWLILASGSYLVVALVVRLIAHKNSEVHGRRLRSKSETSPSAPEIKRSPDAKTSADCSSLSDGNKNKEHKDCPLWSCMLTAGQSYLALLLLFLLFVNWSLCIAFAVVLWAPYIAARPIGSIFSSKGKIKRKRILTVVGLIGWFAVMAAFVCPVKTPLRALRRPIREGIRRSSMSALDIYNSRISKFLPADVPNYLPLDLLNFGSRLRVNPDDLYAAEGRTKPHYDSLLRKQVEATADWNANRISHGVAAVVVGEKLPVSESTRRAMQGGIVKFIEWVSDKLDEEVTMGIYRMGQRSTCVADWLFAIILFGFAPALMILFLIVFILPANE